MADVIERRLTLPCKYFRFRSASSSSPTMATSCCRNLFGPSDPDELQLDLQLQRGRLHRQSVERWNFEFESETPLDGRFEWQPADAAATRQPDSCGRLSPREDSDDDGQSVGARLDPVQIPTDSTALRATAPSADQHIIIPSLTGSSAASADVPVFPLSPRRKRRASQRDRDDGRAKRRHDSARRRTVIRRQAQLVHSAGAARVTDYYAIVKAPRKYPPSTPKQQH